MASSVIRDPVAYDPASDNRRSFWVAAALVALTLSTFAVAAGRGPESAIKLFHEAVKENDGKLLSQVAVQPPEDADVQELVGRVRQLISLDSHVELGKIQSVGPKATVDVTYNAGRYGRRTVRFVVVEKRRRWQIDAKETLDLYRRPLGL